MKNVEKKELAKKLGVDNILVSYFLEDGFKPYITVIIDKDYLMNYIGRSYTFIPTTAEGLNKKLSKNAVNDLLNNIHDELTKELDLEKEDLEIEKE